MANNSNEIWATGRRKCAIARVRIKPGTGKITINDREMKEYFASDAVCGLVKQTLAVAGAEGKLDICANIQGGGIVGQAGALRHGIARAIIKMDETLRATLKAAGLLTRDARVKERKKPGQPGARRRFQFSKR